MPQHPPLGLFDAARFSSDLRAAMLRRQAQPDDVAAATGVSVGTLRRILSDNHQPSLDAVLSLCNWMAARTDRYRRGAPGGAYDAATLAHVRDLAMQLAAPAGPGRPILDVKQLLSELEAAGRAR